MRKHSLELKKRRLEKKIKQVLFFFIFPSLFLFSLFLLLFNSNLLEIKNINVYFLNKNNFLEKKKIINDVENILDNNYYNIFSKKNFIFYPKDEIIIYLRKKYPAINKIKINYDEEINSIKIEISEDKEKNIYCDLNKNCYYLSDKGKIFAIIKTNSDIDNSIIFQQDYAKLKLGNNFFANSIERKKMYDFINFLENIKKIKIKSIIKVNPYMYKIILFNKTKIILPIDFKLDDISLKLNYILEKKEFEAIKNKYNNIVYIDLSLNNRILYCLKSDTCENNF